MIPKPPIVTEAYFTNFVRSWFKRIAAGDWEDAFAQLDLSPEFGGPYTPERFRHEIEEDHFCEGTVFREDHPEGIIYSDPDDIGESKRVRLYEQGRDVALQHLVPLNGEWSDLTAHFDFLDRGDSYAVKLEWLHVL